MGLREFKFALLCHEVEESTGFPSAFAHYLQQQGVRLTYIRFPFFYSITKAIWIEKFAGQNLLSQRLSWIRFYQPQLLSFAKDILWLMTVGWVHVLGSDFVLVSDNLLGFAALILRKLGIIKRFTYLIVDYSPRRFQNSLVEKLYVYLDRLVATHADSVWTMNRGMLEARERDGRINLTDVNYLIASMGNYSKDLFAKGEPPYRKRDLVYMGNGNAKNVRADLLLDVARLLQDRGEDYRLIFICPNSTMDSLRQKAQQLNLGEHVVFHGAIPGAMDLERFLAGCGIGLAPYDPTLKDNFSKYGDPGKIKSYLGCGLPVISTDVPVIAHDLQATGAGRIAEFSVDGFAKQILDLWSSEQTFLKARAQARQMGEKFSWPAIFDRLLADERLDGAPTET